VPGGRIFDARKYAYRRDGDDLAAEAAADRLGQATAVVQVSVRELHEVDAGWFEPGRFGILLLDLAPSLA
jgi:hypothetical protein